MPIRGFRSRRGMTLRDELILAALPSITVLVMLVVVRALTQQRFLYGSLAASAFLIYLDPEHTANSVRALLISQLLAALFGFIGYRVFGEGYLAAGNTARAIKADSVGPYDAHVSSRTRPVCRKGGTDVS